MEEYVQKVGHMSNVKKDFCKKLNRLQDRVMNNNESTKVFGFHLEKYNNQIEDWYKELSRLEERLNAN